WRHYRVRGSSVPQAWRRLPGGPPLHTFTGLGFNRHGNSFMMRSQWNARHCRHTQSPVNIRTGLPESLGSFYTCPPSQESPDPCAEETVPRALSRCGNGKRRLDGPLSFETPDPKRRRQSPEPRPSAFRPVWRRRPQEKKAEPRAQAIGLPARVEAWSGRCLCAQAGASEKKLLLPAQQPPRRGH
ncbi:hypothetical protein E2I00_018534, partial [Balaenoptera physalus]